MLGRTPGFLKRRKVMGGTPQVEAYQISSLETELRSGFSFESPSAYMFHGTCQRLALACHHIPGRASTLPIQLDCKLQGNLLFLPPTSTRDFWDYRHTYYHTCLLCEFCRSTRRFSHPLDKHLSMKSSHQSQHSVSQNVNI